MDKIISNHTSIAKGNAFIGRNYYINEITTICLENQVNQYNSIALYGYKKCGKSSLIHYTLDQYIQKKYDNLKNGITLKENLIIVRVNLLKNGMNFVDLWQNIINELKKEIINDLTTRLMIDGDVKKKAKERAEEFFRQLYQEEFDDFLSISTYDSDFTDTLQTLFEKLVKSNYRTLVFLDTFDYVEEVFEKQSAYFQFINSIKDDFETFKITFLLSSRRSVKDLEMRSTGSSVYFDKFQTMVLGGYNGQDLEEYEQVLENYCVVLNEDEKKKLQYYCGNSPYLLSLFGWEICVNDCTEMYHIYKKYENIILQHFGELAKLMKETDVGDSFTIPLSEREVRANCFYKLKEIFLGPRRYVRTKDLTDLQDLGYIILPNNILLSETASNTDITKEIKPMNEALFHFMEEYWVKEKEDIWPTLGRLEKRLRDIIHDSFMKLDHGMASLGYLNGSMRFNYAYENKLYEEYKKRVEINERYKYFIFFDKAFSFLMDANRKFNDKAAKRIVDMISFKDLGNIISFYWNSCDITVKDNRIITNTSSKGMKRFFGTMEIEELTKELELLDNIRNPLAHFFRECLDDHDISDADKYCNELLTVTDEYTKYL